MSNGDRIKPLDVATVQVQRPTPEDHQPENWLSAPGTWEFERSMEGKEALDFLHAHALAEEGPLLGNISDRVSSLALHENPAASSLALITPSTVKVHITTNANENRQVRAEFEWAGENYSLAVTDTTWEPVTRDLDLGPYELSSLGFDRPAEVFLTISLGEEFHGSCFKLVAAIVPVPTVAREPASAAAIESPTTTAANGQLFTLYSVQFGFTPRQVASSGRFKDGGWVHEGTTPWTCSDCGSLFEAARKPYLSSGKEYRYWALMCAGCRRIWAPQELPAETRTAMYGKK